MPDTVLEHAAFELSRTPRPQEGVYTDNKGPSFYEITAFVFKSHALQYIYMHHYDWSLFLGERVRQMTGFGLRKLKGNWPPTELPADGRGRVQPKPQRDHQ